MPFTKLASNTHNISQDRVYILCSGKQYNIIIGTLIADKLGWKLSDKGSLFIGSGEHEGILRIEPSDNGYTFNRQSQGSTALKIQRGNFPDVERVKHEREFCKYEIVDAGLNIELPEWCLPSDLRRPAARPSAPSPARIGINERVDIILKPGTLPDVAMLKEPVERRCDRPNCNKMFKTNVLGRTFCGSHRAGN